MDTGIFSLKWSEFEEELGNSFKVLRKEQKLFDITLATDDDHQMQAHKVILAAGSDFFSDIFSQFVETNMLVCLNGITSSDLDNIIHFLYSGEILVTQEEFDTFMEAARELKIKGLLNMKDGIEINVDESETNHDRTIDSSCEESGVLRSMDEKIEVIKEESIYGIVI